MIRYTFSAFQVGLVEDGSKRRTIRALNRKHAAKGDGIVLATGRPTYRAIREAVCAGALPVVAELSDAGVMSDVRVDGASVADLEAFAALDGFKSAAVMGAYFRKLHGPGRFNGVMILW